jgi:hypothetical protein
VFPNPLLILRWLWDQLIYPLFAKRDDRPSPLPSDDRLNGKD